MSKCIKCANELLTGDIHWEMGLCNNCYNELYKDHKTHISLDKMWLELAIRFRDENDQLKQQLAEKEKEIEMLNLMISTLPQHDKELEKIHNQDKIELLERVKEEAKHYGYEFSKSMHDFIDTLINMKIFKIEIWQYHTVVDTYESNDMAEILEWYVENWKGCYENGGCTYYVYKNNKGLSFDEIYQLGFED